MVAVVQLQNLYVARCNVYN